MKISIPTAVFSIYFVISASFMRYVLDFINLLINDNSKIIAFIIFVVFIIAYLGLLVYMMKKQKFLRILIVTLVVGLIVLYSFTMEIIAERVHLIQFGIVGFLISLDNLKINKIKNYVFVFFWCFLFVTIDEIFQYFLPTRVGDVRDVWIGLLGSLTGVLLYISIFKSINFSKITAGEKK